MFQSNMMLYFMEKDPDVRTTDWFLLSPGIFVLSLVLFYLIVKVILPKFMEKREPYKLKKVLVAYNAAQIVISVYLFYLSLESWFVHVKASYWKCNSVDRSNDPGSVQTAVGLYLYLLSKYTEFLDTIFFVLRKKFNQASFLHLYHHISTPALSWLVVKYYPGGSFVIFMLLNSFVHIVMYSYYLLAGLGPHMQKYLWWKKYITGMQLVQFVTALVHVVSAILTPDCNIPRPVLSLYLANSVFLYVLFSRFYKTQYGQKRKEIGNQNRNSHSRKTDADVTPTKENLRKRSISHS